RRMALAMAEAHRRGVVHRDLKPSNVMINRRGDPVLMDLGLAPIVDHKDARETRLGDILGSPAYMAPERVCGDVPPPGTCCDIYSLGVILYEMLTGKLPFEGAAPCVLARVLTEEPLAPSTHCPELDPALEAICLKAMAKQVPNRYGTMKELAKAL